MAQPFFSARVVKQTYACLRPFRENKLVDFIQRFWPRFTSLGRVVYLHHLASNMLAKNARLEAFFRSHTNFEMDCPRPTLPTSFMAGRLSEVVRELNEFRHWNVPVGASVYCWILWRMWRLRARGQFFLSNFTAFETGQNSQNSYPTARAYRWIFSYRIGFQGKHDRKMCKVHVFRSVPSCTKATPLETWKPFFYFRVVRISCRNPRNCGKK